MSARIRLFTDEPAIGLRLADDRRKTCDRRADGRDEATDRRRGQRRRFRLRSALFSLLTVALPTSSKLTPLEPFVRPSVSTTVMSFDPVRLRRAYDHLIYEASLAYNVDAALIRSVIQTESAFDTTAVSRAGAAGLMQLMPDVAEKLGVRDRFDPRENIMGGARLLRELLDQYHGNLPLVLAGYNAGAKAVRRFGTVPPFPETRDYVQRVTRLIKEDNSGGNNRPHGPPQGRTLPTNERTECPASALTRKLEDSSRPSASALESKIKRHNIDTLRHRAARA
jgi:hypothetical protein